MDGFPERFDPNLCMFKIWKAEGGWSFYVPPGTPADMREVIRIAVERLAKAHT